MSKRDRQEREVRLRAAARARAEREARKLGPRQPLSVEGANLIRQTRTAISQANSARHRADELVVKMKNAGLTWEQIAGALNTTRQGAFKRYEAAVNRIERMRAEDAKFAAERRSL
jgi:hypothetical protein